MRIKLSSPSIWIANKAVDFRKSINGLCEIVISQFKMDIREGIYIFYNRAKDKLKLLAWHGNGFILIYKRLEQGKFTTMISEQGQIALDEKQFSWLLAGLDWVKMSSWKELVYSDFT